MLSSHPFGEDTSRTHVSFLAAEPDANGLARLAEADHGSDRVHVSGADVFLHYAQGVQGSTLTGVSNGSSASRAPGTRSRPSPTSAAR